MNYLIFIGFFMGLKYGSWDGAFEGVLWGIFAYAVYVMCWAVINSIAVKIGNMFKINEVDKNECE